MNRSIVRRSLAVASAALPAVALAVTAPLLKPRLGATIASHWSGLDLPDGFAATWPMLGIIAVLTGALLVVAVVGLVSRSRGGKTLAVVATAVGAPTAGAWIAAAWATADAADPAHAVLGARLLVVPALLLCAGGVLLAPGRPLPIDPSATPTLALADGERAAYSATTGSGVLWAAAGLVWVVWIGAVVAFVLGGSAALAVPAGVLLVAAVAVQLLVPVRLTVDARGVRLVSALIHVPLIRVPLADIARVSAERIDPLQWGGWGYRISGRGRAYVARRGPGIVVHRRNGSAVAITIDAPESPAALANALVARTATLTS